MFPQVEYIHDFNIKSLEMCLGKRPQVGWI